MEDAIFLKYGWVGAVVLFLGKELLAAFKGDRKKFSETLEQVRLAVVELRIHVNYLREDRQRIDKMRKDLDLAWQEIKDIKKDYDV